MKRAIIVLGLAVFNFFAHAQDAIGVFDLRYTLETNLKTKSGLNTAWDDAHAVAALQGIVNRGAPRLYVHFVMLDDTDVDAYWWDKYSREGQWLHGKKTKEFKTIEELVSAYAKFLKGVVVYDGNVASTSAVASAVAGIEDILPLRYDEDPDSLYFRLVKSKNGPQLKPKVWLVNKDGSPLFTGEGKVPQTLRESSGSVKTDPYVWFVENYMKKGKCNTQFGAYYIDQVWKKNPSAAVRNHHTLSNHDFFISRRAFFFDLSPWGDEPPPDDLTQKTGTDLEMLKELLLIAYRQNGGKKMCYIGGFPPWAFKYTKHVGGSHDNVPTEWEFSRIISAYNAFKDADAIGYGALANASFWQHFPLKKSYPQKWVSHDDLKARGLLRADGKVNFGDKNFVVLYVGDYDASSWLSQRAFNIWDDPDRGKVPLMWAVSPVLQERVPHVMHYMRSTATPNDFFVAADNGAGYLMPGMLQEPRESGLPSGLNAWAAHCKKYYGKWGLTVSGFIIDGEAPGLDDDGMRCYASFSPNGIVAQKVPPISLFGNMPVLRSDVDLVGDPKREAANIMERIKSRQPLRFHWFRSILKTPTWYAQLQDELNSLDENVVILDAPSFFELMRIALKDGTY